MRAQQRTIIRTASTNCVAGVFLFGLSTAQPVARADDAVRLEMWEEPSHQQVFVDGPARILDVRIVPGVTSEFHKHRFATTYVVIQDALVGNQFWDQEWRASGPRDYRTPGFTVDNANYVENPYYHRVRNEDQRAFHVIAVINERSATNIDSASSDGSDARLIDNRWFREHRLTIARESLSDPLRYSNHVALIQPAAGSSHIMEEGIAHSFKGAPASFSWHRAGAEFQIANSSNDDMAFVLIEVKE